MPLPVRRNKVSSPLPACPVTTCMALLSGAWAPNVIWYLSARLRELESKGVVARRVMSTSPPSVEYELTDLGRELLPAIQAIISVGAKLVMRAGHSEVPSRQRGGART